MEKNKYNSLVFCLIPDSIFTSFHYSKLFPVLMAFSTVNLRYVTFEFLASATYYKICFLLTQTRTSWKYVSKMCKQFIFNIIPSFSNRFCFSTTLQIKYYLVVSFYLAFAQVTFHLNHF